MEYSACVHHQNAQNLLVATYAIIAQSCFEGGPNFR